MYMVCAQTLTVYKEWLIPPKYNSLLLSLLSQLRSSHLSSKSLLPDNPPLQYCSWLPQALPLR